MRTLVLFLSAGLLTAAPVPKSIRPVAHPLCGRWVSESVDFGSGPRRSSDLRLRFEGWRLALVHSGQDDSPDTPFSVDDSQSPAHLNVGGEPPGPPATPAIYRLDGDTLWWCQSNAGDVRPAKFVGGGAGDQVLVVFRRVKD